jgi:hypothetical protein
MTTTIVTIKDGCQARLKDIRTEIEQSKTVIKQCREVITENENRINALTIERDTVQNLYHLLTAKPNHRNSNA